MNTMKEKRKEFEAVVEPVIKFLNDHGHPHMTVIIDSTYAELVEGLLSHKTVEFIRD